MLRIIVLPFLLFASVAAGQSQVAADHLMTALNNTDSVSFFFLSKTEEYSFSAEQLKSASTIKIYRACGRNCQAYMKEVLTHLRLAVPVKCQTGQQNLLIETGGGIKVLYSYSGRMIEFEGKCYFNQNSVDEIIKRSKFLFN